MSKKFPMEPKPFPQLVVAPNDDTKAPFTLISVEDPKTTAT
ncbi:hypothetical protein [Lysinibacillus pakistanensis]